MHIQKNDVITDGNGTVLRVLEVSNNKSFVVECNRKRMPYWISNEVFLESQPYQLAEINEVPEESAISVMHKRYTMIADILPVVADEKLRSKAIAAASNNYGISKQTIRSYLWMYLVAQDKGYLVEAIAKTDCSSAELWIGKETINIKMKFAQIKLRSNEKELKPLLQELIQENFDMPVFNYNELLKVARGAGLIEYVNEMEGAC